MNHPDFLGMSTTELVEYSELVQNCLNCPSCENCDALGEWFEQWGEEFRTGNYFTIDDDHRLYRIIGRENKRRENGMWENPRILGYELQ